MSVYSIAKLHVDNALNSSRKLGSSAQDMLHALLVTVVERYNRECGEATVRSALDFQRENLADRDYEFMRP